MSEEVSEQEIANANEGSQQAPPWGSDEEFSPERAWALIQNLRSERDDVKVKHTDTVARLKEFEDAKLSAEERAARDLEESRSQMSAVLAENALLKAGVEYGLSQPDLALLEGLPAEAIPERAAALAERLRAAAPADLSGRPKPALRGGATPGVAPEKTPEQIVAEIYGK